MIFVWRNRNFIVMARTNQPHGMINMTIAIIRLPFESKAFKYKIKYSVYIILDKNGKKSNAYDLF